MAEPQAMGWREGWRALWPMVRQLSGAGSWLLGGCLLSVLALLGGLGLLGLSGAFLTGAAIAGLSASTAALFNFFMPGAGVRFFAVLRTSTRWGERVLSHEATFRLLAGLRVRLYQQLSALSPRQLLAFHGGELLNRLVRDIDALDNLYPRVLMPVAAASMVFACMMLLFAGVAPALLWMPLSLGAMAVLGLPALGWLLGRGLLPAAARERAAWRTGLLDTCEGLEELSLQRQSWRLQREHTLTMQAAWLEAQQRSQRRAAGLRALVGVLVGVLSWACLGQLGEQPAQARLSGPWMAALVLLLMGCTEALLPLAGACLDLPGTASAAQRLHAIGDQAPAVAFPVAGPSPQDSCIDIEHLDFEWNLHQPVFRGLELHVAAGEHVLLTGGSGCGKSSLIQLLTRMDVPQRGHIRFGGVPIDALDEATLRAHVACALQSTWAQSSTLAANLRLAHPEASEADMLAVLDIVGLSPAQAGWSQGLNTWIDEGGANLSGGQRRRLGIARALIRRAPITLLDEPTEGLDLASELALVQRVTTYLEGRTLVWASHRAVPVGTFDRTLHLVPPPLDAMDQTTASTAPAPYPAPPPLA
jgi:ATP-binding cassette, subfamily C, bacterial CydC